MQQATSFRDMASAAARRASGVGVSPSKHIHPAPAKVFRIVRALSWRASAQDHVNIAAERRVEGERHNRDRGRTERVVSADSKCVSFTRSRRLQLPEENPEPFNSNNETTVNVLGLGQAMVDFSASVELEVLATMRENVPNLEYGGRACVDAETRGEVLTKLDGQSYKLSAGGSLSNTLVALSRMTAANSPELRVQEGVEEEIEQSTDVSIACSLGPDPLGEFYRNKLKNAGVQVLSEPGEGGTTGSVIVLTTPDAQRTMLSCWGTSARLPYDDALDEAVANADVLVVEGYLWEMPETIVSIKRALVTAKKHGVTVALTASDASCVEKHADEFWELLQEGDVDVFFANRNEALAMTGFAEDETREAAIELAKYAKMVAVTDGSHGSYLVQGDSFAHVPPHWLPTKPVDTCGAGDAYAAGILFGILQGRDPHAVGRMGARVASVVIGRLGARLTVSEAEMLMSEEIFQDKDEEPMNPSTKIGDKNMRELSKRVNDMRKKDQK